MLAISSLTLFLCAQDFKANGINKILVRTCARLYAHKTCFQPFRPNLLNFYRIKFCFNVFWEPLKNLKLCSHFCHSALASLAVAGVFTYARGNILHFVLVQVACPCTVSSLGKGIDKHMHVLTTSTICRDSVELLLALQASSSLLGRHCESTLQGDNPLGGRDV